MFTEGLGHASGWCSKDVFCHG